MTKDEKFMQEFRELINWDEAERRKIDEELKARGKYREGLDVNQKYYRPIIEEGKKRYQALIKKYRDLPDDLKFV